MLCLEHMPTPDQVESLRPRIKKARHVCLDYATGPGIGMGDYLVKEFGEWKPEEHKFGKVELCTLTNSFKLQIFPKLRMAMEKRNHRIPISRVIREDLHSINRIAITATGSHQLIAPHTADGHADRGTAIGAGYPCWSNSNGTPGKILHVRKHAPQPDHFIKAQGKESAKDECRMQNAEGGKVRFGGQPCVTPR